MTHKCLKNTNLSANIFQNYKLKTVICIQKVFKFAEVYDNFLCEY